MLIWTNLSADPCQDAYKWACGKFDEEYSKHSFYGYNKGEWNFKAYQEYKGKCNDILFVMLSVKSIMIS